MVRVLAVFLLMCCNCATVYKPTPEDTAFDENKRNWLEVYKHEIKVAVENQDEDAYHFFMHEYLLEKVRLWKLEKAKKETTNRPPSP